MDMTPQTWPEWYDGRHINEVLFCQQFLDKHPMKGVRGRLFTVDGLIEDEGQIGNLILEEIYSPPLPIETDRIHVANGTYFMDGNRVSSELAQNERLYNVETTNNVHVGGKRVRGFVGIEVVNPLPY